MKTLIIFHFDLGSSVSTRYRLLEFMLGPGHDYQEDLQEEKCRYHGAAHQKILTR